MMHIPWFIRAPASYPPTILLETKTFYENYNNTCGSIENTKKSAE
jgi:hypothetical protein